ncbi:hypothetical protein NAP1_15688 [Erythrobacter sp. NAP1]|uniref:TonB family protein n=1 Tax=Erythrobacter sp. NAP1 TaxID=237727 RepID=UPI0000687948|nr:TonB family protein [Erythrobacter sp. NAP1]EAQ29055.1 hypothetical protein NAP1_15688 [Erythrobacter sp. NAP1]
MSSFRTIRIAALASACAAISVPALASEPISLERSSQWNVDFAPDKCRLAAMFGPEDDRHYLFFEQHYPNAQAGLTVAGPALKRFRSRGRTSLKFYEGQEDLRTEPFTGELDTIGNAVIYSNVHVENGTAPFEQEITGLAQLDADLGDKVEFVSVRQRGREVRFETGPLGEAFKVLNSCTQDMVREWGLDVDQHLAAASMPKWLNEERVASRIASKYPTSALMRGEQAILRMRVIVGEDGRVERCQIDAATTTEKLDSPACAEMQEAEFQPAMDASGQPFRSYYATSIIYQMARR